MNNLDRSLEGSEELFSKLYLGRAQANPNDLASKKGKTEGDVQVDCKVYRPTLTLSRCIHYYAIAAIAFSIPGGGCHIDCILCPKIKLTFHDLTRAELVENLFFVALLKFWIIVSLPLEINLVNEKIKKTISKISTFLTWYQNYHSDPHLKLFKNGPAERTKPIEPSVA